MKTLTILCDMDGIIVDLFRYWLDCIERDHGVKVLPEEITRWDMHKCGALNELGAAKVYAYLQQPGFFRNAPALPGALDGLQRLLRLGHKVVIVSSPSGPISAKEKLEWLAEHAPFLKPADIMLANQKTLVCGDVLIDDHPKTLVDYGTRWKQSLPIGIRYPYNADIDKIPPFPVLVEDYTDTAAAWERIFIHIDNYAWAQARVLE